MTHPRITEGQQQGYLLSNGVGEGPVQEWAQITRDAMAIMVMVTELPTKGSFQVSASWEFLPIDATAERMLAAEVDRVVVRAAEMHPNAKVIPGPKQRFVGPFPEKAARTVATILGRMSGKIDAPRKDRG